MVPGSESGSIQTFVDADGKGQNDRKKISLGPRPASWAQDQCDRIFQKGVALGVGCPMVLKFFKTVFQFAS